MLEELYELLKTVCQEMNKPFEIPLEQITEETPLRDLQIDSLTFIMLMLKIEDRYHVNMAEKQNKTYQTVGEVMEAIK